jgi:phage gp29-like protein
MAFTGLIDDMRKYAGKATTAVATAVGLNAKTNKLYAQIPKTTDDLLAALTAAQLKSYLDDASRGDCSNQARLIGDMLEKDPVLAAHFETRKMAVLACDMMLIRPGARVFERGNDKEYIDLWNMLLKANIYGLIDQLLDAIPRGYAGSVIEWGKGGADITRFRHIHPTNIVFDDEGNPAIHPPGEYDAIALAKYHPNQFVMHYYRNQPESPARSGVGRSLAWPYYFKHTAMKSWVRFLEKFGIPFLMARISEADFANDALKAKLILHLRNFAQDGAILTTQEGGVEAITIAGTHNRIHEEFVKMIDQGFAIAILGQIGSSLGEAGRLGNNKQQDDVRRDRVEADCRNLMNTVNTHIIDPVWRFRHGTDKGKPLFIINFIPPEDMESKARTLKTLADCNYRMRREQVSYDFNVELEEEQKLTTTDAKATPDAKKP